MMRQPWFWPAVIVGLLMLGVGANVGLLIVASSDPSFAVESDYYAKAVRWDEKRAQDAANDALNWNLTLSTETTVDAGVPVVQVGVHLTDRDGAPVDGAEVSLETFHLARSADPLRATPEAAGPGWYVARVPMRRPGLWEFRFEITRGTEHFTERMQQEVRTAWSR